MSIDVFEMLMVSYEYNCLKFLWTRHFGHPCFIQKTSENKEKNQFVLRFMGIQWGIIRCDEDEVSFRVKDEANVNHLKGTGALTKPLNNFLIYSLGTYKKKIANTADHYNILWMMKEKNMIHWILSAI